MIWKALAAGLKPAFGVMALLTVAACNGLGPAPRADAGAAQFAPTRTNDRPTQGYHVTLRFSGLPGELADLTGSADFQVSNIECVAVDYGRAVGGVRLAPRYSVPLNWVRAGDGSYSAVLHADALLDEDYFGRGVCRWRLQTATARFASGTTRFIGGVKADEIMEGDTRVQHYLVRDFSVRPTNMDYVFGQDAGYYRRDMGPEFTMTVSARPGD